jgi:hypothetical protein
MTAAVAFAAGVALCWVYIRWDRRPTVTAPRLMALDRRPTIVDPTTPWPDLPERPDSDWLPDPAVTAEINSWLFCTNDGPTRYYPGRPRRSGEPDTVTPFQSGSEALMRAISRIAPDERITTGEVRAVVEGAQ